MMLNAMPKMLGTLIASIMLAMPVTAQNFDDQFGKPLYSSLNGDEWRMLNSRLYDEQPAQFERALLQVSAAQRLAYSEFLDRIEKQYRHQFIFLVYQLIERGDVNHARFISVLTRLTREEQFGLFIMMVEFEYEHFDAVLDLIERDPPQRAATALRAVLARNGLNDAGFSQPIGDEALKQLSSVLADHPDYHEFLYFGPGIVNGTAISINQAPFQAQLYRSGDIAAPYTSKQEDQEAGRYGRPRSDFERWHACGAVLLRDNWVLTAAHCLKGSEGFPVLTNRRIRTGADSLLHGGTTWKILGGVRHGGYNRRLKVHDIAILKIAPDEHTDPASAREAAPARLPRQGDPPIGPGETLWVSGFGVTGVSDKDDKYYDVEKNPRVASPLLLSAALTNVPLDQCNRHPALRDARLIVSAGQICAVGKETHADSCQGDSGGPLRRKVDDETVVVGLVQTGIGCGLEGYPGVYVDLRLYVGWIKLAKQRFEEGSIVDYMP